MKPTISISVTDFVRDFSRVIHRVAFGRERFLLLKGGKPVAEVSPPLRGRRLGELREALAELPHLTAEDAAAFGEDMEAARAELAGIRIENHWES